MNNFLSFSEHIHAIVKSAKFRIASLFRSFSSRHFPSLIIAYKSFIRPLLEYCTVILNPHLISEIKLLESVQRLFSRRLIFPSKSSYKDRLSSLHLDTLEKRRVFLDLQFCYKLIEGLVPGDLTDYGISLNQSSTRGNDRKLFHSANRTDSRKYFFAHRVSRIWNSLENDLINAPTLGIFKSKLSKCDLTSYLYFKF